MGTLTKGEIILYPFPYTNLSNTKLRPCLVLSNEMNQDVLLCQITSQRIQSDEFSIELNKDETEKGSLLINSFIRCNMLFTADTKYMKKVLCKISSKKYNSVYEKIRELIFIDE
jgi:mRNA interferase MazF